MVVIWMNFNPRREDERMEDEKEKKKKKKVRNEVKCHETKLKLMPIIQTHFAG